MITCYSIVEEAARDIESNSALVWVDVLDMQRLFGDRMMVVHQDLMIIVIIGILVLIVNISMIIITTIMVLLLS